MGSIYDNNARALFFLQITMSLKRALSSHQPFPNQSGIGGLQPVRMPVLNKLYPPPNRRARGRAQAKNLEPRAAADCRDLLWIKQKNEKASPWQVRLNTLVMTVNYTNITVLSKIQECFSCQTHVENIFWEYKPIKQRGIEILRLSVQYTTFYINILIWFIPPKLNISQLI